MTAPDSVQPHAVGLPPEAFGILVLAAAILPAEGWVLSREDAEGVSECVLCMPSNSCVCFWGTFLFYCSDWKENRALFLSP